MAAQTGGNPFERRNLVLIGFMATGKSAVGRELAARLERRFVDTDALVEEAVGLRIPEIFRVHGEAYFREQESAVIAGLGRFPPGSLVVATGGGAVLRESNLEHLRRHGLIILLTASVRAVLRRTGRTAGRPLLPGGGNRRRAVLALLQEREHCYRRCDLAVDTTNKRPPRVAAEIIRHLYGTRPETGGKAE